MPSVLIPIGQPHRRIITVIHGTPQPIRFGASFTSIPLNHQALSQDIKDHVVEFEELGTLPMTAHSNWAIFQFGRAQQCNYRTFVGLEEVEAGISGKPTAIYSLSRYAFRIAVDVHSRAARIFAGGFCTSGKMFIRRNDTITTTSGEYDGFAGNSVCIRKPGSDVWYDVTVRGNTYIYTGETRIRTNDPAGDNSLVDGTLISVGGIVLLYRNMDDAEYERRLSSGVPDKYAAWKKLCCPVSYMALDSGSVASSDALYVNLSTMNPALRSVTDTFSYTATLFYEFLNNLDTKVDGINASRPFVFPQCGHVFGFLKPLYDICRSGYRGKAPCPICRTPGPYVPLRISAALELADILPITDKDMPPTHVFNPCGHCTSESIATAWEKTEIITIATRNISGDVQDIIRKTERTHLCPYCGVALNEETPVRQLYFEFQATED